MAFFASRIAPEMAQRLGRKLLVGIVGCSSGEEAWSLAAALTVQDVPYAIEAFDANQEALNQAQKPYPLKKFDEIALGVKVNKFPKSCVNYFTKHTVWPKRGVYVSPSLKRLATFTKLNVQHNPIPAGRYDAVFMTNVLYHYKPEEQVELFANVMPGLTHKGLFTVGCYKGDLTAAGHLANHFPITPMTGTGRWDGTFFTVKDEGAKR